jgi:hypothetical protein
MRTAAKGGDYRQNAWVSGENLGHQIFQSTQTHAEAKVKRFDRLKSIFR